MFRKIALAATSVLLASTAMASSTASAGSTALATSTSAGFAAAAEYDVRTAQNELTAAAAVTRTEAAGGYSSTGTRSEYGERRVDVVVDATGAGRITIDTDPEDRVIYIWSSGSRQQEWLSPLIRQAHAAGLAYIDRPDAAFVVQLEDPEPLNPEVMSGSNRVEHLERSQFTFLTAEKIDDGDGHLTYSFTGYDGVPTRPATVTATLTDGLVTGFSLVRAGAGGPAQKFETTWEYGPQEPIVLPPGDTVTKDQLAWSRSAVVLKETVRAHARELAALAKARATKADRRKVSVRDVRVVGAQIMRKYSNAKRYPLDALPTTVTSLTGGVVLYASDPFRKLVRIATVQVYGGKIVLST